MILLTLILIVFLTVLLISSEVVEYMRLNFLSYKGLVSSLDEIALLPLTISALWLTACLLFGSVLLGVVSGCIHIALLVHRCANLKPCRTGRINSNRTVL